MMAEENDNEQNFQDDIGNAQSNEADISERDLNNMSEEEEEPPRQQLKPPPKVQKPATAPPSSTPQLIKRCMNDMCPSSGPVEVVKVDKGAYQYLCQHCFKQYKDNHYCYYCKQIYFGEDDGEDWIECDKCKKWTHADCEESKGEYKDIKLLMKQAAEFPFQCPNCRPKSRFEKRSTTQALAKEKSKLKRNDIILNSYGFFWRLKPDEIQSDLEKMRNL